MGSYFPECIIKSSFLFKHKMECCENDTVDISTVEDETTILTYLLTYSMEQSPSWEANQ
jgi:hypothetical protein